MSEINWDLVPDNWPDSEAKWCSSLKGQTITEAYIVEDDDCITLKLADGRTVHFIGQWHNDSTAGVSIIVEELA